MTFSASSVALWRKIDARIFLYGYFNQAEQWCDVLRPFLGRLVRIILHQANFSPFNIVQKIDDRFIFRFIYTSPGIEISMGLKLTSVLMMQAFYVMLPNSVGKNVNKSSSLKP